MRRTIRAALLLSAVLVVATDGGAQATADADAADSAALAFRDLVRQGTARFADRNAAIRAGYRAVGGEFPAMGRHWVHPGVILRGKIEPDNPAILSYVEIKGAPVLVGVAFAIPLAPGEEPPLVAGRRREWHEHNGSVAEESLIKEHAHGAGDGRTRLAILHVWSSVANPEGIFATDNWALPFIRAGLVVPDEIRPGAARAVALLSGGADYYATLMGGVHGRSGEVMRLMKTARQHVAGVVQGGESPSSLTSVQMEELERLWKRMVTALESVAGESAAPLRVAATSAR